MHTRIKMKKLILIRIKNKQKITRTKIKKVKKKHI